MSTIFYSDMFICVFFCTSCSQPDTWVPELVRARTHTHTHTHTLRLETDDEWLIIRGIQLAEIRLVARLVFNCSGLDPTSFSPRPPLLSFAPCPVTLLSSVMCSVNRHNVKFATAVCLIHPNGPEMIRHLSSTIPSCHFSPKLNMQRHMWGDKTVKATFSPKQ